MDGQAVKRLSIALALLCFSHAHAATRYVNGRGTLGSDSYDGTSATVATLESAITPSVAGTYESVTVTGLTPETVYYFALRTSNATRTSNTSNCVSERTWPSGTMEP